MIDWVKDTHNISHVVLESKTACGIVLSEKRENTDGETDTCEVCIDMLFGLLETAPGFDA